MTPDLEFSDLHSLGVARHPDDIAMESLLQIDRQRLVERHDSELKMLDADIEGLKRHASDLGNQIRSARRREDRLMWILAGTIIFAGYLAVRDIGCPALPWWFR